MYKPIRWVLQENLVNKTDVQQFIDVFQENDIPFAGVRVTPFERLENMWWIDERYIDIYYGSTRFIGTICNILGDVPGIFSRVDSFCMSKLCDEWGKEVLNYGGIVLSLEDFINHTKTESADTSYFVRPNDDSKSIDGRVWSIKELTNWYYKLSQLDNDITLSPYDISPHTSRLFFSRPWGIEREWRTLVVQGRVVSSSLYRVNGYLHISGSHQDNPTSMKEYVEKQCALWAPADVFVMDVCWSGEKYWIIECGGVNSAGLYAMDYGKFCLSLGEYVLEKREYTCH